MPVATKKALAKKAQKITKTMQTAKTTVGKKIAPLSKNAGKPVKAAKRVYSFGAGKGDGDGSMKPLLGGKGANLAEMSRIGLPVPRGSRSRPRCARTSTTTRRRTRRSWTGRCTPASRRWRKSWAPSSATRSGRRWLVAVRSGARDSMPGMMDTILNLGLNDQSVLSLAKATGNDGSRTTVTAGSSRCTATWSWACRSCRARTTSVRGRHRRAEARQAGRRPRRGHGVVDRRFEGAGRAVQGAGEGPDRAGVPQRPVGAVDRGRRAVFSSWMNDRAKVYRPSTTSPPSGARP